MHGEVPLPRAHDGSNSQGGHKQPTISHVCTRLTSGPVTLADVGGNMLGAYS